jgi:cytidylate kinase
VIVAIDGPASSGKSTTARAVAERLGLLYLDTGAMYRAVALAFLRADAEPVPAEAEDVLDGLHVGVRHDADGAMRITIGDGDDDDVTDALRAPAVTRRASEVSALPAVREKLVEEQRRIAAACEDEGGGVVLDGRDIGTVVFPEADVKIFLVADAEVRARRRRAELIEKNGETPPLDDVLENLRRRDEQDRAREMSPLRQAEDAVPLDTTERSIEEQVEFVAQRVREHRGTA